MCACQMHMPLMWTHACTLVHMPYICPMHPTRIPQDLGTAVLVTIGGIAAVWSIAATIAEQKGAKTAARLSVFTSSYTPTFPSVPDGSASSVHNLNGLHELH